MKIYKFAGILILTGLTLAWSKWSWLQKGLKPLLQLVLIPMNLFAVIVGSVITLIAWPFRMIWAKIRPQQAA